MPFQKLVESTARTPLATSPNPSKALRDIGLSRLIVFWLLFFSFSLALGYPMLNRYDARKLGRDQDVYYKMVLGTATATPYEIPFCFRLQRPAHGGSVVRLTVQASSSLYNACVTPRK